MSEQGMRGRRGGGRPVRGSGSGGGADEVADIQPPSASAVTSKLRRGRSATRTCHHPDNSAEGVGNAEEVEASTALLGLAGAPVGVPGVGQQQAGENGVRGKRACSIPRGHWTPPKRARKGVSSPPGARDPGELPNAKRRLVTTSAGAARSAAAGSSRRSVTARRSVADSDGKVRTYMRRVSMLAAYLQQYIITSSPLLFCLHSRSARRPSGAQIYVSDGRHTCSPFSPRRRLAFV